MLDALDLSKELSKARYKEQLPPMQRQLHQLQQACWKAKVATIVVFEGWDAAGRGAVIGKVTQRCEPRGFSLHSIRAPRSLERHLPWMWRFWNKLPAWGEIAIFDHSWYGRVLEERVEALVDNKTWQMGVDDILAFEQTLALDRYLMIKFFLHISQSEQKARLQKLAGDPATRWRVSAEDWARHAKYDEYRVAVDEMIKQTSSELAPWTLVEATDRRWARFKVFDTLITRMRAGLAEHPALGPKGGPRTSTEANSTASRDTCSPR